MNCHIEGHAEPEPAFDLVKRKEVELWYPSGRPIAMRPFQPGERSRFATTERSFQSTRAVQHDEVVLPDLQCHIPLDNHMAPTPSKGVP